ncbi:MAG: hypothetical protein IPP57_08845 [Candidatus Obscuribacter sp.]|nr:hypothetical protein [Candidatus Obscuribacter sp.]
MTANTFLDKLKALGNLLMPKPTDPPESKDAPPQDTSGKPEGEPHVPWYQRQERGRNQRLDGALSGVPVHLPEDENYSHRYYGDRWGADSGTTGSGEPPRRFRSYQPEIDEPFKVHTFHPRAELLGRTPRVLISPDAFKRMCLYVEIGALEVGWLGTVTRTKNGDFLIGTTYLLQQDVSPTETILSVDGINALAMALCEQGEEGMKALSSLRFWGHSHVRMGTSPSGTDEQTMERFGTEGHEWYVRGIFNKRGRAEFTIYLFDKGLRINDAPWEVFDPVTNQVIPTRKRFSPVASVTNFLDSMLGIPAPGSAPESKPAASTGTTNDTTAPGNTAVPDKTTVPATTPADSAATASTTPVDGDKSASAEGTSEPPKPVPPPPPPKLELPEELIPSAALRQEIEAEFKAKVKERVFRLWSFFGNDKKDTGAAQPGEPTDIGQTAAPSDNQPGGDKSSKSDAAATPAVKPLSLKERIFNRRAKSANPDNPDKDKDPQ